MNHGLLTGRVLASASRHGHKERPCNLCGRAFHPHGAFERFCKTCKKQSELLRFSEWLPYAPEVALEPESPVERRPLEIAA